MPDLSVDVAVLQATRTSMDSLREEFDGIEQRAEESSRIYGHDGVRDAMHEFSHNMTHHREELSEKMGETAKKVSATIDAFLDADQKLAEELEKNTTDEMPEAG